MRTIARPSCAALAAGVLLLAASPATHARRYRGERYDIYSGAQQGRWIINVRKRQGGALLKVKVRCKPGGECGPFAQRLRFEMTPGAGEYAYEGTFELPGTTCALAAYVYPAGFEGVYTCDDTSQGSISGRHGGGHH